MNGGRFLSALRKRPLTLLLLDLTLPGVDDSQVIAEMSHDPPLADGPVTALAATCCWRTPWRGLAPSTRFKIPSAAAPRAHGFIKNPVFRLNGRWAHPKRQSGPENSQARFPVL